MADPLDTDQKPVTVRFAAYDRFELRHEPRDLKTGGLATVRLRGHGRRFGVFPTHTDFDVTFPVTDDYTNLPAVSFAEKKSRKPAADDVDVEILPPRAATTPAGADILDQAYPATGYIVHSKPAYTDRVGYIQNIMGQSAEGYNQAAKLARLNDQQAWFARKLTEAQKRNLPGARPDPDMRPGEFDELRAVLAKFRTVNNAVFVPPVLGAESLEEREEQVAPILEPLYARMNALMGVADPAALRDTILDNFKLAPYYQNLQDRLDAALKVKSSPDARHELGFRKAGSIRSTRGTPRPEAKGPIDKLLQPLRRNPWLDMAGEFAGLQRALFNGRGNTASIDALMERHGAALDAAGIDKAALFSALSQSCITPDKLIARRIEALRGVLKNNARADELMALRLNPPRVKSGAKTGWVDIKAVQRALCGSDPNRWSGLIHARSERLEGYVNGILSPGLLDSTEQKRVKYDFLRGNGFFIPVPEAVYTFDLQTAFKRKAVTEEPTADEQLHNRPVLPRKDAGGAHAEVEPLDVKARRAALQTPVNILQGYGVLADALLRYSNPGRLGFRDIPWAVSLSARQAVTGPWDVRLSWLMGGLALGTAGVEVHRQVQLDPVDLSVIPFVEIQDQRPSMDDGTQIRACLDPAQYANVPEVNAESTQHLVYQLCHATLDGLQGYYAQILVSQGHYATIEEASDHAREAARLFVKNNFITQAGDEIVGGGAVIVENAESLQSFNELLVYAQTLLPDEAVQEWQRTGQEDRILGSRAALTEMAFAMWYLPDASVHNNFYQTDPDTNMQVAGVPAREVNLLLSAALSYKEAKFGTDINHGTATGPFQFIGQTGMRVAFTSVQSGFMLRLLENPDLMPHHRQQIEEFIGFVDQNIGMRYNAQRRMTIYSVTDEAAFNRYLDNPFISFLMHRHDMDTLVADSPQLREVQSVDNAFVTFNQLHVHGTTDMGRISEFMRRATVSANCDGRGTFAACVARLRRNAREGFDAVREGAVRDPAAFEGPSQGARLVRASFSFVRPEDGSL